VGHHLLEKKEKRKLTQNAHDVEGQAYTGGKKSVQHVDTEKAVKETIKKIFH
jgi:hypothetical protein